MAGTDPIKPSLVSLKGEYNFRGEGGNFLLIPKVPNGGNLQEITRFGNVFEGPQGIGRLFGLSSEGSCLPS